MLQEKKPSQNNNVLFVFGHRFKFTFKQSENLNYAYLK